MTKLFNIQKNHKEKDTQPDYRISFQEGSEWVEGGACWKRTDINGNSYLSCKLRDAYKDKPGFSLEKDQEEKSVVEEIKEAKAKTRQSQDDF